MLKNKLYGTAALVLSVALSQGAMAELKGTNVDKALKKGQEYMVLTNYPNNLQIIDLKTETVYKRCEMPGKYGPGQVQMSPDKSRAYILTNSFKEIYGVNVDTCKLEFRARFAQEPGEVASSMFSMAVSADGKEVYTITNPTIKYADHYRVQTPRLQVYSTADGVNAKAIRTFPAPRQMYVMQAADDGSLYAAGPDFYKVDVNTGEFEVAIPLRNWGREGYGAPDVLYFWPHQQHTRDFSILYAAPKYAEDGVTEEDFIYGFINVNLKTGKTERVDFASLSEVYFTGMRHPFEPNKMYGVLNNLNVYDIENKKQIKSKSLDHTYYNINFNVIGDKIYLAGTLNDVSVHDAKTLKKVNSIKLEGGDQAITTAQIFIR